MKFDTAIAPDMEREHPTGAEAVCRPVFSRIRNRGRPDLIIRHTVSVSVMGTVGIDPVAKQMRLAVGNAYVQGQKRVAPVS